MDIKIEKGIEIPPSRKIIYPFYKMEVGDSFSVPRIPGEKNNNTQRRLIMDARNFGKKNGWKFITRSKDDSVRIWRIA